MGRAGPGRRLPRPRLRHAGSIGIHRARLRQRGGTISGTIAGSGITLGAAGPGHRLAVRSDATGYIQVPNNAQFQLAGATSMSYEAILKSDVASPPDWMTAQDFANDGSTLSLHGYAMYANGGGGPNTANIELFSNNQDGGHGSFAPCRSSGTPAGTTGCGCSRS